MAKYSKVSQSRLMTCNPILQDIFNELIQEYDHSILCGERGKEDQDNAFNTGKSKAKWGQSKHNVIPGVRTLSDAVDAAPYPIDWNDHTRFSEMNDKVQAIAKRKNVKINWGGNFKSLRDLPHWEIG